MLLTFVFKEVAHARSSGENQLRDVLDDLRLVLGRQGGKPFGKTLSIGDSLACQPYCINNIKERSRPYHFTLPRQQDQVAAMEVSLQGAIMQWGSSEIAYWMAMLLMRSHQQHRREKDSRKELLREFACAYSSECRWSKESSTNPCSNYFGR